VSIVPDGASMMLPELKGSSAAESFMYWGERKGWLYALSQHRDSEALTRSNWRVIVPQMLAEYPEDAAVEQFHDAMVGWTEHLLVRPGTPAAAAAEKWHEKLENYPIANEEDFSALEWDEEWCVRCDMGIRTDHPLTRCHKFRAADDASEIRWRWENRHKEVA
jgi:hypothetical protein